jgi:hypothetical protein
MTNPLHPLPHPRTFIISVIRLASLQYEETGSVLSQPTLAFLETWFGIPHNMLFFLVCFIHMYLVI